MRDSSPLTYKESYEQLQLLFNNQVDCFKLYLVKQIKTSNYRMAKKACIYDCSDKSQDELLHQVTMLRDLKNPHVIKYYDVFLDGDIFIIILEFCEEGDLQHYLKRKKDRKEFLSEKLVLSWVVQILMALDYLHSNKIIHRLISAQNIFLNHQGDIKLGAFGAAKILETTMDKAMTIVGSPCNLSPEIVEGNSYDSKADIWALGCLIYELTTFQHPFKIKNLPQLYDMIVKSPPPDLPSKYSKYLNPIYKKMMKKSPTARPSASQLLQQNVLLKLMKEYTTKKKIDSLDLREIKPKQLQTHNKKNHKSILPPLSNQKSSPPNPIKTQSKKVKSSNEPPLSKSREKLKKIDQQSLSTNKSKQKKKQPKQSPSSPLLQKKQKNPSEQQQQKQDISSRQENSKNNEEIIRLTELDQKQCEYISLLFEFKLEFIEKKYKPNMSQIFQEPIQFDDMPI